MSLYVQLIVSGSKAGSSLSRPERIVSIDGVVVQEVESVHHYRSLMAPCAYDRVLESESA
jgi:hypothetical protein